MSWISKFKPEELNPMFSRLAKLHTDSENRVPRLDPSSVGWYWVQGWLGSILKFFSLIGIYEKFTNNIFIPIRGKMDKDLVMLENTFDASFVHELSHAKDRSDYGIFWCMTHWRKSEENAIKDECQARHFNKTWATMTTED